MGDTCLKEVTLVTILIVEFYLDSLMATVYEQRKDPDGFLYIIYTDESTYGADLKEESEKSE
jgi:hypothetical protein